MSFVLESAALHARPAAYEANFTMTSNSLNEETREIGITVRATVLADTIPSLSNVSRLNASAASADNLRVVGFEVISADLTGMRIDSPDVVYYAQLTHLARSGEMAPDGVARKD